MNKKKQLIENLKFYFDNDLDEIISDKAINYLSKNEEKNNFNQKENIKKSQDFIKPVWNVSTAISSLAKKSNNIEMTKQEITKTVSLNKIIEDAKKIAKNAKDLADLKLAVEKFDGCNLKKMATNTVFCDGNPDSKIMVIGEAPGNHEDLQGIPFCGDSGKLLDEIFLSIELSRKNFYITNVIFWRPPGNRRPSEEELQICRPFVERHIELVNPKIIILVGATAMNAILGIDDPITKIRGQITDFSPKFLSQTIKTFVIFHPSYLMRQPSKKKIVWQDMLTLEKFCKNL